MALIKCPECGKEISDKAGHCPSCGAPVVVHKWICSKCGNMISREPCTYCDNSEEDVYKDTCLEKENRMSLADPNHNQNQQAMVQNNKNEKLRIILIIITVILGTVIILTSQNHNQSKVKHGAHCDAYDDNGDGWVDRVYDRELKTWWEYTFKPGEFSMDDVN